MKFIWKRISIEDPVIKNKTPLTIKRGPTMSYQPKQVKNPTAEVLSRVDNSYFTTQIYKVNGKILK